MAANIQGNNKSERLLPPPKHVNHHTVRRVCGCEVQGDRFDKGHESSGATAVSVFLTTTQIFGVPGDYFLEGLDYFEADADVEWVGNASELGSVSTRIARMSSSTKSIVERGQADPSTPYLWFQSFSHFRLDVTSCSMLRGAAHRSVLGRYPMLARPSKLPI